MRRLTTAILLTLGLTAGALLVHARATATNPLQLYALAEPRSLEGRVVERVPAGPYVYLRLAQSDGQPVWVASLRALASGAEDVTVSAVARADRFTSKRLGRSFSPLLFGAVRAASPTTQELP